MRLKTVARATGDEGPPIPGPEAWKASKGFGYDMGRSAIPDSYWTLYYLKRTHYCLACSCYI